MKYQIYLNKEVSNLVESMAKEDNVRPSTFLKNFLESIILTARDVANNQMLEDVINAASK